MALALKQKVQNSMAVDFSTNQYDPLTGTVQKKKQQLPYLNDGQQQNILPMVNQGDLNQGNQAVTSTAQNMSLQGTQTTPVQQQTSEMVQKMMTDPNFGYNSQQQKTATLSAFDKSRAESQQAARRAAGDVGGSGEVQSAIMKSLLAGDTGRAELSNQLDTEAYQTQKQNWLDALTAGQAQTGLEANTRAQAIENLLNTRNAYEGERSQNQAQQNTLEQMATQQGYDIEKIKQGQTNVLEQMSTQQGYDLTKMDKEQANILEQMARDQGYDLSKMGVEQANVLEQMAAAYGYDLGKMSTQQKYDLVQMAQQQGYSLELQAKGYGYESQIAAQQQGYDLEKMDKAFGQDITKMVTQSELDTESKRTLMQLQEKIDRNILSQEQDWQELQNQLDRQAAVAAQQRDAQLQTDLLELKGQIDAKAQQSQQEFTASQNAADRVWQTSERVDTQAFQQAAQYYDWEMRQAEQANDIDAQYAIQELKNSLQIKMQINDMNQAEKMAYLNSQLAIAEQNNDADNRGLLLGIQSQIDYEARKQLQGYTAANMQLQQQIDTSLQNNDYQHTQILQDQQLSNVVSENLKDRQIESMKIQLEQIGMSNEQKQAEWDQLLTAVQTGSVSSDALYNYMENEANTLGITIDPVSDSDLYVEISKQMNALRYQFLNTHPEYVDQTTGWLNSAGQQAFNDYYNEALASGELSSDAAIDEIVQSSPYLSRTRGVPSSAEATAA